MDVVKNAEEHVNPGQTTVVTLDQPLFALAKQIQWKWPEKYGEGKMVVMYGGLNIEMAALKMLGDWLRGSGWVQALVQAYERRSESFRLDFEGDVRDPDLSSWQIIHSFQLA